MTSEVEIERKFLFEHPPEHLELHLSDEIEQRCLTLTGDGVEVRVRRYGRI